MGRLTRHLQLWLVVTAFGIALSCTGATVVVATNTETISESALQDIRDLELEKASRSPLHRKLDSQFVYKIKQNRAQQLVVGIPTLQPDVRLDADGRVLVDIDATVSDDLIYQIEDAGGEIVASVPKFHNVRAWVPFDQLETLAGRSEVKFIKRAARAQTFTGSVTSQGDATHGVQLARAKFGVTGAGVKVGVLSDSVDHLSTSQASGDLPTNVVVLTGQGGYGNTGEGTAMLEIIHDLAPDAQLYFATAYQSEASFAQNILNLRDAGCDIILDDVYYFDESPFQDGMVAQAVNSVTADGALYFSSAGNNGNLNDTTSTTWEGDFVDGGAISPNSPIGSLGEGGSRIHDFGTITYNRVLTAYNLSLTNVLTLFWSDPLGGSSNDYDLFVLNSTGTRVLFASGDWQNGTQDPFEACYCAANDRIVIVKYSGEDRFLHLQIAANGSARLNISTAGNTLGHCTATNAFCVAAVNAAANFPNPFGAANPTGPYPGVFTGGDSNPVEWFSSDGPRKVFFHADGTPITPGNFSATGGAIRQKPDITAADGVSTSVSGFSSFYGTSAAAPHAAGIAALLKSYNPALSPTDIRTALTGTALDISTPGFDRDSGAGIVMAGPALQFIRSLIPVIESISVQYETSLLTWSAMTNRTYQVQYTTEPFTTNWINLGDPVIATSTNMMTLDELLTDPQRFYRIQLLP